MGSKWEENRTDPEERKSSEERAEENTLRESFWFLAIFQASRVHVVLHFLSLNSCDSDSQPLQLPATIPNNSPSKMPAPPHLGLPGSPLLLTVKINA